MVAKDIDKMGHTVAKGDNTPVMKAVIAKVKEL